MQYTERLHLRPFTQADAEAALTWLGDAEVMRYIEPLFDLTKARDFITVCGHLVYCLCEKQSGTPVGHVIWHPYMGDPARYELGWILARTHWGRGYASEISQALLAQAKAQGIAEVILETGPENRASIARIESRGAIYSHTEDGLLVYRIRL